MMRNFPLDGRLNQVAAIWMMAASLAVGMILGLWSFDGPLPAPAGWEDYTSLARRLTRLGHIAGIAIPLINLVVVRELSEIYLLKEVRARILVMLFFGMLVLPALLIIAAFVHPAKYLLPLPSAAMLFAIAESAFFMTKANFRKESGI